MLHLPGVSREPHDAPVSIVEFSDFQCRYCAYLQPTLEQVKQQYGDKLRFVYRHFLLTAIHPRRMEGCGSFPMRR